MLAAFHKTGGFFHPLLAFARTFGCMGMLRPVSLLDHVLVYWLAASLGAVVAMYTAPYYKMILQRLIKAPQSKWSYLDVQINGVWTFIWTLVQLDGPN